MPFPDIKPNTKKVFLMNSVKVGSAALVVVLVAAVFIKLVGGEFLVEIFEGLGFSVEVKFWQVFLWFIVAVAGILAVLLVLNYITVGSLRYEFQPDKIVCYSCIFYILINSKDVPYENIVRINFDYKGFFNSMFNTGTITIELTAMKEREVKMEFIDNAEQVAKFIQRKVQEYKSQYYAQRAEEYRVDKVLSREDELLEKKEDEDLGMGI